MFQSFSKRHVGWSKWRWRRCAEWRNAGGCKIRPRSKISGETVQDWLMCIVCIISSSGNVMESADLIKLLERNGWQLERIRGSHHQFSHLNFAHLITVPHPKKI